MFTHRSFLLFGTPDSADIVSLIKGGYEVSNYQFSFQQGVGDDGKVQTEVFGGTIHLTLPMLPPEALILWGLKSRQYRDGVIVSVDEENIPVRKVIFTNAACIGMMVGFKQRGSSYSSTMLTIQAEKMKVGRNGRRQYLRMGT